MFEPLSEQLERRVDLADVDHDLAPDPVVAERLAIRPQRVFVARARGDVVVGLRC